MYTNKLTKITIFLLLAFVLTGCETSVLPNQVSDELEEISGVKIASVVLVDSKTGKTERFKHVETEEKHAGPVSASKIENITSISVVRVTGVEREDIDENYQFCNYITIDGHTELICKNTEIQESDHSQEIPNIPPKLAVELESMSKKVNNLSFLILADIENGQTKLFKRNDYEQVTAALPQAISEIGKSTVINIVNFKGSPCCEKVIIDGHAKIICRSICL